MQSTEKIAKKCFRPHGPAPLYCSINHAGFFFKKIPVFKTKKKKTQLL